MYYDPAATGERIQTLRKNREVTQEQLAIGLNISDRYMRNPHFTIDFETAKRYREANKMPHQFRRAAWTDLTVEVYL